MIQPDSEFTAAHEFFAILIKFFVMGQIEIVNKSTSSYCFMNPDFLLRRYHIETPQENDS